MNCSVKRKINIFVLACVALVPMMTPRKAEAFPFLIAGGAALGIGAYHVAQKMGGAFNKRVEEAAKTCADFVWNSGKVLAAGFVGWVLWKGGKAKQRYDIDGGFTGMVKRDTNNVINALSVHTSSKPMGQTVVPSKSISAQQAQLIASLKKQPLPATITPSAPSSVSTWIRNVAQTIDAVKWPIAGALAAGAVIMYLHNQSKPKKSSSTLNLPPLDMASIRKSMQQFSKKKNVAGKNSARAKSKAKR